MHVLSDNVLQNFKMFQDELQKGYPAKWHVDADAWLMYKELVQWKNWVGA